MRIASWKSRRSQALRDQGSSQVTVRSWKNEETESTLEELPCPRGAGKTMKQLSKTLEEGSRHVKTATSATAKCS
jgi:hypothetical protein